MAKESDRAREALKGMEAATDFFRDAAQCLKTQVDGMYTEGLLSLDEHLQSLAYIRDLKELLTGAMQRKIAEGRQFIKDMQNRN